MEYNLNERREKILEMLTLEDKVEVNHLSEIFNVSSVMIRRDLAELESQGLLSRVHGGAVSSYKTYYNMNFTQRYGTNEAEKKAIGTYVAETIHDNDTLFMNSGTTTLCTFRALSLHKNISIITNSIAIALEAAGNTNFNVVLLGGTVNTKYQFTFGDDAIRQLGEYNVDKLILSVDGIDFETGLSTYYNQEAEICRQMIKRANSTIVVADYTKIGRRTLANIAPIDDIDIIVTNDRPCDFRGASNLNVEIIRV